MTGGERGRGQDEFLRPELTAWFSALLLFIVLVGALGYAVGCLIIAPMFLGEGFARHCLGVVLALASLLWAVGRQHVQLAIRAFWAELGVYLALLCQVAFVAVLAYLAGYFFSGSLLSAGLARHCVAAATVVASLYWGRKWWRAWRHTGEADDLYRESKDGYTRSTGEILRLRVCAINFSRHSSRSVRGGQGLSFGSWHYGSLSSRRLVRKRRPADGKRNVRYSPKQPWVSERACRSAGHPSGTIFSRTHADGVGGPQQASMPVSTCERS